MVIENIKETMMDKLEIATKLRERNDELSDEAADLIDELIERYRLAINPLSKDEIKILEDSEWEFLHPYYIYIPDDYDGCFAEGLHNIRRVIDGLKRTKS